MTDFMKPMGPSRFDVTDQWVEIVTYRGFYDVPRVIMAKSKESTFWIFESVFDDGLDDYQCFYRIYFAGEDEVAAIGRFERHLQGAVSAPVGDVAIADVEFDVTTRAAFKISRAAD